MIKALCRLCGVGIEARETGSSLELLQGRNPGKRGAVLEQDLGSEYWEKWKMGLVECGEKEKEIRDDTQISGLGNWMDGGWSH